MNVFFFHHKKALSSQSLSFKLIDIPTPPPVWPPLVPGRAVPGFYRKGISILQFNWILKVHSYQNTWGPISQGLSAFYLIIEKLTIAVVRRVAVPGCSPGAIKTIQFK